MASKTPPSRSAKKHWSRAIGCCSTPTASQKHAIRTAGCGVAFGVVDEACDAEFFSVSATETLRRIPHAVATHHDGSADDDATLLLAEWSPVAAQLTLP